MKSHFGGFSWLGCVAVLLLTAGCGGSNSDDGSDDPPVRVADPVPSTGVAENLGLAPHGLHGHAGENSAGPSSGTSKSGERKYAGVSFDEIPADWVELLNQQFVDSKFTIATDDGELEVTLTSMGGGIQGNIERWAGQVRPEPGDRPKREKIDVGGLKADWIDVRGTFGSRVGKKAPRENWRLLGVAVPIQPRAFYMKVVGPRDAVAGFHDAFRDFAKSAKVGK